MNIVASRSLSHVENVLERSADPKGTLHFCFARGKRKEHAKKLKKKISHGAGVWQGTSPEVSELLLKDPIPARSYQAKTNRLGVTEQKQTGNFVEISGAAKLYEPAGYFLEIIFLRNNIS